ncbi:hypothetical protein RI129_009373 [Pyrocoelia pectoralis]|uniref:Uncharacterized protein n=1 Tax=Pyrocoelia pectoralis TaxID=417401 RepID=A0AAN7V8D4_9COLE
MKASLFIILTTYLIQALSLEIPDTLIDDKIKECFAEHKVEIEKLFTILDEGFQVISEDPLVYTLADCVSEKKQWIKNGEFNKESIVPMEKIIITAIKKDIEDHGKATEIAFDKCKNQKGERDGVKFVQLHNCMMREA